MKAAFGKGSLQLRAPLGDATGLRAPEQLLIRGIKSPPQQYAEKRLDTRTL
jgi:hypothetical protein